jgi:TRAP-type uncharacterized transport system fused permease subunit
VFFSIAADMTVILHLVWIIFLIFGALPGRRHKWTKRVHVSGLIFALIIQTAGWYCPLTYIEIWLRNMHDPLTSYSGSFIINYVNRIVYMKIPQSAVFAATVFLIFVNVLIYRKSSKRPVKQTKRL